MHLYSVHEITLMLFFAQDLSFMCIFSVSVRLDKSLSGSNWLPEALSAANVVVITRLSVSIRI